MTRRWRCIVCGYIHDGDAPPYRCPICGAPARLFEEVVVPTDEGSSSATRGTG